MMWPKTWHWQKTWKAKQSAVPCCNRVVSNWIGIGDVVHSKGCVARFEARARERANGSWSASVTLHGVWYFAVEGAKSRAHAMRVLRFAAGGRAR